ncbi:hypothetical protein CS063_15235 [Sporanaerobium hydrogeniformans]|uniref:Uncharacterized protein n=1 Tax=Sporanaerobium hydrogeniformans TaxID=3072179 RepID=A0AC61D8W6_9FIRM|nr:uroporphyrinogen decarboxylase family protein [Sporanaerobium hydrogeniformans]PHV69528.1 hypothetical protein CS063_15235 [Sporanaerobium hydrogeniformans]
MLPRDRVIKALAHERTDRVPLDFWATPETWKNLKTYFNTNEEEEILRKLQVDIRQVQPDYIGPKIVKEEDGTYFDAMGVHRRVIKNEFCEYEEYASAPLGFVQSVEDFERYNKWPNISNYDFKGLKNKIGPINETYYIKLETGGLFEFAWALRGYEQFMMDMILEPDIVHFIMNKITEFWCDYVREAMEQAGDKYDMVYTYDDIAAQNSLLMSKEMWAEFIKPYHERLNQVIHSYGKTIMYHSCGAVYDMIEDLKKLPIDVLNPIQPRAKGMDMKEIKKHFKDVLSFHGGIDIQFVLPKGTKEEVDAAVRHAIDTLGEGGGYILTSAHYIQADTPVENIVEMYKEAREYSQNKNLEK